MHKYIGIDFGTTNSAIAITDADQRVTMAYFGPVDKTEETFRSVLFFEQVRNGRRWEIHSFAGPEAIAMYLDAEQKGRLIQSLKSYLSSRLLVSTNIFGKLYMLEELIGFLIRRLREQSELSVGSLFGKIVVGRPVRFSGAESDADNDFAQERVRTALMQAGINDVVFEYEPVGAAYYYESLLDHEELVLIGDFGGGTSDFSLLRVGPIFRSKGRSRHILGNEGVALAGDAFDAKIVRHVVSPLLGKETLYRSMNKSIQVPAWVYVKLERWHYLSFLKTKETMDMLRSIRAQSTEPEKIDNLINVISDDLGFYLHRAVQRTKFDLSEREASIFSFQAPGVSISRLVTRKQFEEWIQDELDQISQCVDRLLAQTGVTAADVDRVFLTGGSSFVPAVRQIFAKRFGDERLASGSEFTSVAKGLALRSLDLEDKA